MSNRWFRLRQVLRRHPGVYRAREIQKLCRATKGTTQLTLRKMEQDGEVIRWGTGNATRWQILPREIKPKDSLWYHLGWPDPMKWPKNGVSLGYSGGA